MDLFHYGNSRYFLYGNGRPREPFARELAIRWIHAIIVQEPAITRIFTEEPTTAGPSHTHVNSRDFFHMDFSRRGRPLWDFIGRERANIFVGVVLLNNDHYLFMHDT